MAASVSVAVDNIPPFVILDEHRGIELDIFSAAMTHRGHQVDVVYSPILRARMLLEKHRVDAAISLHQDGPSERVFYSTSHIQFKNVAISLTDSNVQLDSLEQLKNYRIAAFKMAREYLGKEYESAVAGAPLYTEVGDPPKLMPLLYKKRVDVIIIEESIFKYLRINGLKEGFAGEFRLHELFEPTFIRAGFADPGIRDDFELGLKAIIESGAYHQIYDKYLNKPTQTDR